MVNPVIQKMNKYSQLREILRKNFAANRFDELYRVLPSRSFAPEQWDEQIHFWTSILVKWMHSEYSHPIETTVGDIISSLEVEFEGDIAYPPLIPTIQNMLRLKHCKLASECKQISLIQKLWKFAVAPTITNETSIVFTSNLNEMCEYVTHEIEKSATNLYDCILSESEFLEKRGDVSPNVFKWGMFEGKFVEKIGDAYFIRVPRYKNVKPELIKSMSKTKDAIEKCDEGIKLCEEKMEKYKNQIQALGRNGDKSRKLKLMQYYKLFESKCDKLYPMQTNLIQLLHAQESTALETNQIEAIKSHNEFMKTQQTADELDKVISDVQDLLQEEPSVGAALAAPVGETFDDAALEAELDSLLGISQPKKASQPQNAEKPKAKAPNRNPMLTVIN